MMGESSKSPFELMCCRGCLATNVNLYDIHKNHLAEAFGCITGHAVIPSDGFPQQLCGVCGSLLAKSAAFRERCRRTQDCLQKREQQERNMDYIKTIDRISHNLVFTLALTQLEVIEFGSPEEEVKHEVSVVVNETIFKEENVDSFNLVTEKEFNDSDIEMDNVQETPIDLDDEISEIVNVNERGNKINIEKVLIPMAKVEVKKEREMKTKNAVKKRIAKEINKSDIEMDNVEETTTDLDDEMSDEMNDSERGNKINIEKVLIPMAKVEVKKEREMRKKNAVKKRITKKLNEYDIEIDNVQETPIDLDDEMSDEINDSKRGNKINIEKVLIPMAKVEVRKEREMRKKNAVKKRTNLLKKLRITGPSPTNEYQPNFDVAALEKELNVDVQILSMEQQLADWREFSASKKTAPAFTCQECGKGFDRNQTYNNHLLRHSPTVGAYPCEVCRVRFARRSIRRSHRQRHALRIVCRECRFVTKDKNQAKLHHSSHAGLKFQCQHCEKTFIKRSSYLSHVRLAHAAQNVSCEECGETFVSHLGVAQHQTKMHKAQKAASKRACASCKAKFDSAEALDAHTNTGCDPAQRPCSACGAALPSEEALLKHTAEHHKEEFKCTECPLTFSGEASRDTHYWRVHRAVRRARGSPKPRTRKWNPARWNSRVCAHCGKQLQSPALLREHMRIHTGEKPFACTDCPLKFNLRANLTRHHRVVHLGQRPMVKCPECGKRLGAASLATHINYVHKKRPQKPRVRRQNTDK